LRKSKFVEPRIAKIQSALSLEKIAIVCCSVCYCKGQKIGCMGVPLCTCSSLRRSGNEANDIWNTRGLNGLSKSDSVAKRRSRRVLAASIASLGWLFTFMDKAGATTITRSAAALRLRAATWISYQGMAGAPRHDVGLQLIWPVRPIARPTPRRQFNTGATEP